LRRLCRELATGRRDDALSPYSAPATADCLARLRIPDLLAAA
jgi:hypothetical protein